MSQVSISSTLNIHVMQTHLVNICSTLRSIRSPTLPLDKQFICPSDSALFLTQSSPLKLIHNGFNLGRFQGLDPQIKHVARKSPFAVLSFNRVGPHDLSHARPWSLTRENLQTCKEPNVVSQSYSLIDL